MLFTILMMTGRKSGRATGCGGLIGIEDPQVQGALKPVEEITCPSSIVPVSTCLLLSPAASLLCPLLSERGQTIIRQTHEVPPQCVHVVVLCLPLIRNEWVLNGAVNWNNDGLKDIHHIRHVGLNFSLPSKLLPVAKSEVTSRGKSRSERTAAPSVMSTSSTNPQMSQIIQCIALSRCAKGHHRRSSKI
jgi:hypothetical protein